MIKEFEKRLITSLILLPISIFFIIKGSIFFIFFLSILFLVTSYEWVLMSKKNNIFRFLGIIFLFFSFYSAFEFGENYKDFLFIITICIFTDIGGYIFGKILKGPKLTKISPNKTIAGALGSFVLTCTVMSGIIYYKINIFNFSILFTGLLTSFFCQLGDLFFSYLKRKAKLKDTGNLLPGHGGILDRLDGVFFGIPFGFVTLILFF